MKTNNTDDGTDKWSEEVSDFYDYALTEKGYRQAGLIAISDSLAARFLAETGINVFGFCHILDAQGLRHIHREHGNQKDRERLRGQVPITKQDVLDLRLVMTDPNTLALSTHSLAHSRLTRIAATKEIFGHVLFYIMKVRTGRWRLAPVTLYKRKNKTD